VEAQELLFDEVGRGNGFYECWAMDALGEGRMEGPEWGLSGEELPAEVKSPEYHGE
jgi:hypothetical protein